MDARAGRGHDRHMSPEPSETELLLARFRLAQQRRALRPMTLHHHANVLRRFLAAVDVETVTEQQIEEWLDSLDLAARSRVNYIATLAAFFKWAVKDGVRADNPTHDIQRPRLNRLLPRPVNTEALAHAIDRAEPRMRAWLCLAAYQGLRCCEIAALTRESLMDDHVPPLLVVENGKGDKPRILPLHPLVLDALRAYGMPWQGPFFLYGDGRPVTANAVSVAVIRELRGHGIESSAHKLRHWFGTSCYRASRDLRLVQELLGHSDPRTTAGYAAWSPVLAAQVVSGLLAQAQETHPPASGCASGEVA